MKLTHILCAFAAAFSMGCGVSNLQAQSSPNPREFEMKEGDTTYVMKQYILVLLMRHEEAPEIPKEEAEKIQAGHMENINRLAAMGKMTAAGPMGDKTPLRGIFIMDCESIEEAKALVETDPAIVNKRLRAEYHPWWAAKGTVLD